MAVHSPMELCGHTGDHLIIGSVLSGFLLFGAAIISAPPSGSRRVGASLLLTPYHFFERQFGVGAMRGSSWSGILAEAAMRF